MSAKLTILSDNHAAEGFYAEHGFALWIEYACAKILLDTGNGSAIWDNAEVLGINLASVDYIVLSHGHYDHSGNLAEILEIAPEAHLYLHPAALQERYSIRESARFIGLQDEAASAVRKMAPDRLFYVKAPTEIIPGIYLTGEVPRFATFEDCGGPFYLDSDGNNPDPIVDDLSLWFETSSGVVLCLGCCHAGVVNTLDYLNNLTDGRQVRLLLGGMHLGSASEDRLEKTAATLRECGVGRVFPAHCTGDAAVAFLSCKLGNTVTQTYAGMQITL